MQIGLIDWKIEAGISDLIPIPRLSSVTSH